MCSDKKCITQTISREDIYQIATLIMNTTHNYSSNLSHYDIIKYISTHKDTIYICKIENRVEGVFAYTKHPNHYIINFFSLSNKLQKTKRGYYFFCECIRLLKNKPIYTTTYLNNKEAVRILDKIADIKYNIFNKTEHLVLFKISIEKVCK